MDRYTLLSTLAFLVLMGCGPVIAELMDTENTEDPNAPEDETDTGDESKEEGETETKTLTSGTWALTGADLEQDSCGLMDALYDYTGSAEWVENPITFDMFLPSRFDVSATQDQFRIKALDYRAAGYIECTFSGENFACSTQTAESTQVASGWPTYWVYQIEFSGTYINARTVVGDAIVTFPQFNPGDSYGVQLSGLGRLEDCSQSYRLTLETSGA